MELQGKIAVVTGAGGGGAGGMGKGIALSLARAGADVAVNDIDLKTAEATAAAIKAMGRRSIVVLADVSQEAEVTRIPSSGRGEASILWSITSGMVCRFWVRI